MCYETRLHTYHVILDRTGSMEAIRDDTIGGFNAFLKSQQEEPGTATLTLVQFDSQDPYEVIHRFTPIKEVPELTRQTPWGDPLRVSSFLRYSRPLTPPFTSFPILRFEARRPGSECNPGVAGAHRKCPFRILPFSVFRAALFNPAMAGLHPGTRFDVSNILPQLFSESYLRQPLVTPHIERLPFEERLRSYAPLKTCVGGQKGGVDLPPVQQQIQERPFGIREGQDRG